MDSELIQVKNVTKRFKKNLILDNISFTVPEGQIIGIIGASGEGKSTILKLIIGFYKPSKGKIYYLRRDILKDFKNIKNIFGFATEEGSFYEDLNVRENILHFGRLYKIKHSELKKRLKEVLHLVELTDAERTRAKYLSIGMKKRLDIACAIIHNPQVLILDEPTADLDPLLRDEILDLIIKIKREGKTIILTTQLLEEMDIICDRIAILHDKKIVEEGHPNKIKAKYQCNNLSDVFDIIFSGRKIKIKGKDKGKEDIEIPSNSVTLQSGISYRHSRTKDDTINGNVYNKNKNNDVGKKEEKNGEVVKEVEDELKEIEKKEKIDIEIPSNSITLQSGISNRHSRTKGDTINGNVYNWDKKEEKIDNEIQSQIEKIVYKSENPKIEDFGKTDNLGREK